MKTLSDYKDEEAIELWADLMEPLTAILSDKELMQSVQGQAPLVIAGRILAQHKAETAQILKRIDPEPIDGMNILMRFVALLTDVGKNKEIMDFFGSVAQEKSESESSGSATENTGDGEN